MDLQDIRPHPYNEVAVGVGVDVRGSKENCIVGAAGAVSDSRVTIGRSDPTAVSVVKLSAASQTKVE